MSDSQADVYASFGVQSAVLSGSNIEEHRQAMLAQDVAVRDHDDEIVLTRPEQTHDDAGVTVKDLVEDPYGDTDGRIEINVPTDGELPTGDHEGASEDTPENLEGSQSEGDLGEALGEAPEALVTASNQIAEYAEGLNALKDQAISNGLPESSAARMEQEYADTGTLSAESIAELAKAGYSEAFVKSYLQGQESIADQYVASVIQYAGGKEIFDRLISHLQSTSPETVDVLEDAMNRQDLKAIKATINLAKASHKAKFGKAPARTVTAKAPASAARPSTPKVEGFASQDAMVAAMSDPRYSRDPAYRQSVIAKVAASNW